MTNEPLLLEGTLPSRRIMDALYRQSLSLFTQRAFSHLHPGTELHWGPYLEVLTSRLDACRRGEVRRLIVNVPPRHLKSICASVALVAYWLGKSPTAQILCASYAQDLAQKHARDCREVMRSDWYKRFFPHTRLSEARNATEEFTTTAGGVRIATSVGGVLTGRGADVLIIDDPLKPQEALSDSQRRGVNEWYSNTLYSRLNRKETGCIILVMQRLHQDDLVGHVLDGKERWEVLSFPALAEETQRFMVPGIPGILPAYEWIREDGTPLLPEHESLDTLKGIRSTLSTFDWACQYQQNPAPVGGGMIQEGWWQVYEEAPRPFNRIIQSWDTACKESELSDFSVCTTWGEKQRTGPDGRQESHLYLLDVMRKRMNYPDLKRAVKAQEARFGPTVVLIEDKASGTQLIQELQHEGMWKVQGCEVSGDKIMRLHAQTAMIEHGLVHLPKEAPWLSDFRREMCAFPRGRYDDQVDSTSQALAWVQEHRPYEFKLMGVGGENDLGWEM